MPTAASGIGTSACRRHKTIKLIVFVLLFLAQAAAAQDYPAKSVRLIAAAAPGGNPDVLARMLAAKLAESFGRAFVVENIPGAGGVVAAELVARSAPDGHVLMLGDSGAMAINVALNPKVPYHPLKDFTLITALAAVPTVLVASPSVPANSLQEFVALAKAKPGQAQLRLGRQRLGPSPHDGGVRFARRPRHAPCSL